MYVLGKLDAWSTSHLSQQTSEPAYYIVDCWISSISDIQVSMVSKYPHIRKKWYPPIPKYNAQKNLRFAPGGCRVSAAKIYVFNSSKIAKISPSPSGLINNISSVVEFQRWWVLNSKLFGQESTCHQEKTFKKFLRVMTVCQKVPKLYFQSQFSMSKINPIFSKKEFI